MSPAGRKNLLNAPYLTGGPSVPFLTSLPHYFLSPSSLSPLAATLMDPPASVANKRLTVWLNPLDATLTKNTGGGGDGGHSSQFRNSPLAILLKSFPFTFFRTLFGVFAFAKKSTRLFSIDSALYAQNTRGWSTPLRRIACARESVAAEFVSSLSPYFITSLRPYFLTSRNGDALPAAMELLRKGRTVFRREDRSMENSIPGRRWRRLRHAVEFMHVHSVAADRHCVIRRHGEERCRRFLPLNIRQRVARIAKARIAAFAHHHDLQIIGIPMLEYDGDRFFVSDLSRGNRMGYARSLCVHAGDRLRAQVLLFQRALSEGLLVAVFHLALHLFFHLAKWHLHLFRRFCVGVQDEMGPRHGIIDEHKRLRRSRGRQRSDRGEGHFLAETALAIPKNVRLRLSRDMVSVRESLVRCRNGYRAERHAGHHLSAVPSLKTQQLDAFANRAGFRFRDLQHRHRPRWGWRRILRPCQSGTQRENSAENHTHAYSAIHYSFSSSLPNCCELFAAAISAIPAINGLSRIVQPFHRTFASPRTAVFTLSQNAVAPVILYASRTRRPSSMQSLSRQPHRLRQPIISHEKIHLDPIAGAFFTHGQTKRTQRAALHAHAQYLGVTGIRGEGSGQKREAAHFVVRHQRFRFRSIRLPNCRRTLRRPLVVCHGVRVVCRGLRRALWRCQMVRRFLFLPVSPAHRAYQHGRSGQRPRSYDGGAPHFQCDMLRAELLAQTHFHASRSLRHGGIFRERAEINPSRLPGILQRGAPRTRPGVLTRRHALNFAQRSVALRVQSNRFKFFARHFLLPLHHTKPFIGPRSRAEARRETFPVWPSAKPARDAAVSGSSQSGIRPFARLPRNSFLPARTTPRLRETPRVIPARRSSLAACVRVFPTTSPVWTRPAKQFRSPCRLRFLLRAIFPEANVPGVSSPGCAPLRKGMLRALRAWRHTFSDHASGS